MLNYSESYMRIWKETFAFQPEFSRTYPESKKRIKEQKLDRFLKYIKSFGNSKEGFRFTEESKKLFLGNTRTFLRDGLDFTGDQLQLMFSDDLIAVSRAFVRQARAFDPQLSVNDIFQACRNMWIMNGLQVIMGLQIQLTPSILSYSLLYPYTDNLLDDPTISTFEKMIFSERFRQRLSGEYPEPETKTEQAVFRLVEMIEQQYSRTEFPEIFESLLAIHDAQTNSLKLLQPKHSITEDETLHICLAKGGTSVLTDGYLVAGKLTAEQKYFLFGYGAYLQLLDDIQDVEDDYQSGLMTMFSSQAFRIPLDEKLNRTYWFGEEVMKTLDRFDGQHLELFKSLMRRSMDLFITEAVAQNPGAYSQSFVARFESCSPFHFSYIRKRKEQFMSYNGFLISAIEEIALTGEMQHATV